MVSVPFDQGRIAMSKFYVTCGSKSLVVSADSAETAAMRLIDATLAEHTWIYSDSELREQDRRDHVALEALLNLGTTVLVSERGIGRSDALEMGVPELLEQWHQLMTALSRLFAKI